MCGEQVVGKLFIYYSYFMHYGLPNCFLLEPLGAHSVDDLEENCDQKWFASKPRNICIMLLYHVVIEWYHIMCYFMLYFRMRLSCVYSEIFTLYDMLSPEGVGPYEEALTAIR